jgi:putative sterol carrier protein
MVLHHRTTAQHVALSPTKPIRRARQKGIAMTHDTLRSLLERLQAPILPPTLQAATVRYRFTLDGSEQWDLLLHQGRLSLDQTEGRPECLVECTSEELGAVLSGQHNLLTSVMRGDVRIQGALAAAKLLYTFLRYAHLEEANG